MQVRCYNCHKPFALGKEAVNQALDQINAEHLSHFTAYCPHCRRANRISPEELKHSAPDWSPKPAEEQSSSP